MNKRKMIGLVGGAAAVATLAGGGTFAHYKDVDTVAGNSIDADVLQLELRERSDTAVTPINISDMGPGEGSFSEQIIALKSEDNERSDAKLSLKFNSIAEDDNGCVDPENTVDSTCGPGEGELADNVIVTIQTFNPTFNGTSWSGLSNANRIATIVENVPLQSLLDDADGLDLHTFLDDNGVDADHVGIQIFWTVPATVGNVIQSDSSTFDLVYTLEQDITVPAGHTHP
jgi:hypothetical protein